MKVCFVYLTAILAVILLLSYIISLPVFYGIFSFGDIESWQCYAAQDHSANVPWDMTEGPVPGNYHNVKDNFDVINLWGFINFMLMIGFGCCGACLAFCDKDCGSAVVGIGLAGTGLSYLSHFIAMLIMRFRHAGRVCAGDYDTQFDFYKPLEPSEEPFLHKTGSWLFYASTTHIYLILLAISMSTFFIGAVG